MTFLEEYPSFEHYRQATAGTLRFGQAFMNYFNISGRPDIYFTRDDETARSLIEADPALSRLLKPDS